MTVHVRPLSGRQADGAAVTAMTGPEAAGQDDGALVVDYARTRSAAALEALVGRRWAVACRVAYGLLGDPAAAEDAAQQAFVDLARAADRYDRTRPFGPWFREVVRNAARMQARAQVRRRRREERVASRRPATAAGTDGPEERALALEVGDRVRALPDDLQQPILLHFYEGLSHAEVADALGCPKGTAASRIRRGLERLQASLAGAGYGALVPRAPEGLGERLRRMVPAVAATPPPAGVVEALIARAASRALAGKAVAVVGAALVVAAVAAAVLFGRAPTPERGRAPAVGAPAAARAERPTPPGAGDPGASVARAEAGEGTASASPPPASREPEPASPPGSSAAAAAPTVGERGRAVEGPTGDAGEASDGPTGVLEITCTDDQGAILADCEVLAMERDPDDDETWRPSFGQAVTDARGRADIEVPGDRPYGFTVRVLPIGERDFQFWMLGDRVPLAARERRAVTLAVPRKARIEGVLVGGVADEYATVTYKAPFEQSSGTHRLDRGGRFSIDVNPGPVEIVVAQHGRTSARRVLDLGPGQVVHETFALDEGGWRVFGHVRDARDGRPIEGATVKAGGGPVAASVRTGRDGFFDLRDAGAPGSIVAVAEGFLPKDVPLAGPGGPVDVALAPATSIAVRVVGEDGRPLADALVLTIRDDGRNVTTTDRHGAAAFVDLPPGRYTVRAAFGAGKWRDVEVDAAAGERVEVEIAAPADGR